MSHLTARLALAVTAVALMVGLYYGFDFKFGNYGTGDWLVYWSVPRNALMGNGFYDMDWLAATQQSLGYDAHLAQWHFYPIRRLWNPPVLLPLLFPLAALPFDLSVLLWLALSLFLTFQAALLFNRALPRPLPQGMAILIPYLTVPLLAAGYWGQMGPILGAFAIHAWVAYRKKRVVAASLLMVPLLLKPHLFVAMLAMQGGFMIKRQQWRALMAPVLLGILLLLATTVLAPQWFTQWRNQGAPLDWDTMALLDLLTFVGAPAPLALLGPLLAIVLGLWLARAAQISASLFANSLFLSVLLAPYLWYHDSSLMIAPSLWLASHLPRLWMGKLLFLFLVLLNFILLYRAPIELHITLTTRYLCYFIAFASLWWMVQRADRVAAS